jgi:hypothetical protein
VDLELEHQAYVLVKHVGFSFRDVCQLTYIERRDFLEILNKENEKQKEDLKKIQSSGKR